MDHHKNLQKNQILKSTYLWVRLREVRFQTKVNAFKRTSADKRKQVLDSLYQILYFITEHHDLPYNRILNRAIGKVLAMAIKN